MLQPFDIEAMRWFNYRSVEARWSRDVLSDLIVVTVRKNGNYAKVWLEPPMTYGLTHMWTLAAIDVLRDAEASLDRLDIELGRSNISLGED